MLECFRSRWGGNTHTNCMRYETCQTIYFSSATRIRLLYRDREVALEWAKSGMVGEISVRRWSASYSLFFKFSLQHYIELISSQLLNTKSFWIYKTLLKTGECSSPRPIGWCISRICIELFFWKATGSYILATFQKSFVKIRKIY